MDLTRGFRFLDWINEELEVLVLEGICRILHLHGGNPGSGQGAQAQDPRLLPGEVRESAEHSEGGGEVLGDLQEGSGCEGGTSGVSLNHSGAR